MTKLHFPPIALYPAHSVSLCLCKGRGTETFPGFHHCPDYASQLVSQRYRHEPCRFLRQQPHGPIAKRAYSFAYYAEQ